TPPSCTASAVLRWARASPVRLSEPHFDDQPRCNDDAECAKRSYDYAKDKLTGFAAFRLYRCVLKARILLRKPVLSLDTLFSRQVSHVADPKFVPDLGSTEALKASAILVRYFHLSRFAPACLACAGSGSWPLRAVGTFPSPITTHLPRGGLYRQGEQSSGPRE